MAALSGLAERQGSRARLLALGGGPIAPATLRFDGDATAPVLPGLPLRASGVRILLTDGLWPEASSAFLQRALVGAARFVALQLLDPWEVEPSAEGAFTLVDCETGERREVQLDARTIANYRARLERLSDALRTEVVARGGTFARVTADSLAAMCQRDLLSSGVLEPA